LLCHKTQAKPYSFALKIISFGKQENGTSPKRTIYSSQALSCSKRCSRAGHGQLMQEKGDIENLINVTAFDKLRLTMTSSG
jgi:hypothetical protein